MRNQGGAGVRARSKNAISAALFVGASLAGLPLAAHAADAEAATPADAEADRANTVSEVVATGKKQHLESPKYTAPLLDTPQTITVVPKEVIEAQNLMSLRDILSTVPGITFGAGEGGGGYGDSINLRGYSANSDITVDGVRDSAQYTRSDPFNLEQLEVVNGANSVYSGSGSVGGSINLVSKAPRSGDQTVVSAGIGTDSYGRLTVDANREFSDSVVGRLNLMVHSQDAPGRDVEEFKRWGIAPSLTIGADTPTQFNISLFHQTDDNTPQYGVPYASNAVVNGPLPGVNPSSYFGYRNIDRQESDASSLTLRFDHDFGDGLSIRNLTRYQIVTQELVVNPPQGTFCLASGVNPQTGAVCGSPDTYQPSGPRGGRRDTENRTFYNQTDLRAQFSTGGIQHSLVAGISLLSEDYRLDNGNVQRDALGGTPVYPVMTLSNPDNLYTGPINYIRTGAQDGERQNQAIYVFDNIEFNEQLSINAGLRLEHNEGSNRTDTVSVAGVVTPGVANNSEETLFSFRFGGVYKPTPNSSLYLAYGNSETPSQVSVSGGCNVLTNCNLDPEEAENIELGGKWDLASGISLTASIFRNERDKIRISSDPLDNNAVQVLDGKSRVDGIALGASGVILPGWAVFANYTYLDSELLQGVSNANLGVDFRAGDPLPNTPKHAFNIWTTYDVTPEWQVGYGLTYSGEYAYQRGGSIATPANLFYAPDYWLHSLAVTWRVTPRTDLRLNVRNVTDEEYYTRIRSSGTAAVGGFGWATPGDTRNATLTLNHRF